MSPRLPSWIRSSSGTFGPRVVAGDRHHEPQVRLDQLPLRHLVALVLAARELPLFLAREQRAAADLAHVELERVRGRRVFGRPRPSAANECSIAALIGSVRGSALESPNRLGLRWKGSDTDKEKGMRQDTMCGIAGYSLSLAERRRPDARCAGAARRDRRSRRRRSRVRISGPGGRVSGRDEAADGRRAACSSASRSPAARRPSSSSTSATTRRAIRRSRPTTIRSGTAPSSGSTTGSSSTTTSCSPPTPAPAPSRG